jgi:hypothetical protein
VGDVKGVDEFIPVYDADGDFDVVNFDDFNGALLFFNTLTFLLDVVLLFTLLFVQLTVKIFINTNNKIDK